jgi:hypothetical protein
MTTLLLNASTFAELFPPEPPTAPMPVDVTRYDGPRPPPPPPEAFESSPRAPMPAKARCGSKAKRAKVAAPLGSDLRLPSNLKPHSEAPYSGPTLKAGAAKKRRASMMLACGCRLCALALNPPTTFDAHSALGLSDASVNELRAFQASIGAPE